MLESLPQSIWNELHSAQTKAADQKTRMRVEANGESHKVLCLTKNGFALGLDDAPNLRGLVDLYDGGRHVSQCLIVAAEEDAGQMVYEFKRNTSAADGAPLDFERQENAPIALLGR